MGKKTLFRKVKEHTEFRGIISPAGVLIIVFLTGACAGTNKMQASEKGKSELSEITGDQTIECRRRAPTGSRLKKKICKTKAQWAREDHVKQKTAERLQRDADRSLSNATSNTDSMGGMSAGVPR